jgi:hypothetical protein
LQPWCIPSLLPVQKTQQKLSKINAQFF